MGRRAVFLLGLLAGLPMTTAVQAQVTTQRYVGSFFRYTGPNETTRMTHQYDLNLRRGEPRGGRNPTKRKRSLGSPETESAATAALGPGTGITGKPASRASRTSR